VPNYRRSYCGNVFLLTVVTYGRRRLFDDSAARRERRRAMAITRRERPWVTEAVVLLPEHMHMLWRMRPHRVARADGVFMAELNVAVGRGVRLSRIPRATRPFGAIEPRKSNVYAAGLPIV
jgi:hypothetical protein